MKVEQVPIRAHNPTMLTNKTEQITSKEDIASTVRKEFLPASFLCEARGGGATANLPPTQGSLRGFIERIPLASA